jgi:hypothetical protein
MLEFSSKSLIDFHSALKKRSKSLKKKFKVINFSTEFDDKFSGMELANLTLQKLISPKSKTIRMKVWSDRWVWVDARESSKTGWQWKFSAEGRFPGNARWEDLVYSLEETGAVLSDSEKENIEKIWSRILAKGPRSV